MKKLFFATALAIGSLSAVTASTATLHDGIMSEVIAEEFKEIAVSDLPAAVSDAVETDFAGATINKAYMNENQEFKLEITAADGSEQTLYADAEGNWLDM
ncbi:MULTISPECIES: hypothetical protein [Flavobacteriaceae]|uniref:hypothetical protein n=1 Tax=Flavobacteriaceae TaxID=49546 RepID=UPI0010AE0E99|nr:MULTISPECIES: hypothetical protein [Flavobacteriaceae]NJB36817.1 hypothetical protein [Croceivirga sp. JEA036]TKD65368.1 hypothetical protein FBT53_07505 [Flavobacterium sp. ASW18X]